MGRGLITGTGTRAMSRNWGSHEWELVFASQLLTKDTFGSRLHLFICDKDLFRTDINLLPDENSTRDLGGIPKRWRTMFTGGARDAQNPWTREPPRRSKEIMPGVLVKPMVFGPVMDAAIAIVESTAYDDQMRQARRFIGERTLTNIEYDKIISNCGKISDPPDLGYRILNFLYF